MKAAKTWRTWTRKEQERLESLRLHGMSLKGIAAELGRTLPSVKCQLARLEVAQESTLNRYLPLVTRPHTLEQVAQALGVTKGAVKQAKRRLRAAGFVLWAIKRRRFESDVQTEFRGTK